MIKFFRHIRMRFLSENSPDGRAGKFSKYLLYAIGEIILVVFGILIALQINNWNENRKEKIAEFELYRMILMDLKLDEQKIQEHIEYFTQVQSMQYHVYEETKGTRTYDSSVPYQLFRPIRIFDLVTRNNFSERNIVIKNDSVMKKMESYFFMENNIKNAIEDIDRFKNEHLRPIFSKYGIHDTQVFFDNHHLDYFELAEKNYINYSNLKQQYGTVELDQLLFNLGIKTSWALQGLKMTQEEGNKLQRVLENELKSSY